MTSNSTKEGNTEVKEPEEKMEATGDRHIDKSVMILNVHSLIIRVVHSFPTCFPLNRASLRYTQSTCCARREKYTPYEYNRCATKHSNNQIFTLSHQHDVLAHRPIVSATGSCSPLVGCVALQLVPLRPTTGLPVYRLWPTTGLPVYRL